MSNLEPNPEWKNAPFQEFYMKPAEKITLQEFVKIVKSIREKEGLMLAEARQKALENIGFDSYQKAAKYHDWR